MPIYLGQRLVRRIDKTTTPRRASCPNQQTRRNRRCATMPDDLRPLRQERAHAKATLSVGSRSKANQMRLFHERCQTGRRQADVGRHIFQQSSAVSVARRSRPDFEDPSSIPRTQIDCVRCKAGFQFGRQRDSRALHSQWPANPIHHQRLVVRRGFQRDDITEQPVQGAICEIRFGAVNL